MRARVGDAAERLPEAPRPPARTRLKDEDCGAGEGAAAEAGAAGCRTEPKGLAAAGAAGCRTEPKGLAAAGAAAAGVEAYAYACCGDDEGAAKCAF